MIKKLFFAGLLLTGFFSNNAQAQAVEQGNIIIDPYYGFPNFGKKLAEGLTESTDVKVGGMGPLGLRAEYMIADKMGVGIDFIYNSFSSEYTETDVFTDTVIVYNYKQSMNRFRIQARFNYHFVENDNVDAYFGVGAGTNIRKWKYESNDPTFDFNETGSLLPVSLRICSGVRYYFTDNIGINAEIGIGGPVMSAGISIKL